jgi:hypothetical protein
MLFDVSEVFVGNERGTYRYSALIAPELASCLLETTQAYNVGKSSRADSSAKRRWNRSAGRAAMLTLTCAITVRYGWLP